MDYKNAGVDIEAKKNSGSPPAHAISLTHIATQSIPTVSCLSIKNASFSFVPTPSVPDTSVNGFSLVRKIFSLDKSDKTAKETLGAYHAKLGGTLGEVLLAPTKIYVREAYRHAGCRGPQQHP